MNKILKNIYYNSNKFPNKVAIVVNNRSIKYLELWQNICKCATYLKEKGILEKQIVILENSQDEKFCYLFFALNMLKAIALPIDKDTPKNKINKIKSNINTDKVILVKDMYFELENIDMYEKIDFEYEGDCSILLSSGSTGEEKNIIYTYNTIYNIVDVYKDIYNIKDDLLTLITGPLCRAYGFTRLLVTFYYGLTLYIYNSNNIVDLLSILKNNSNIMICTNPTILHYLINVFYCDFKETINNIRIIESCTAPLNKDDALKILKIINETNKSTKFYNFYGSTELQIAYLDITKYGFENGCVGKLLSDTYIEVLDENQNKIISNKEKHGIIRCYNEKYMFKYLGVDEIKYFYPGEIGYIENDFLYLVDREKSFFNINGFKVSPLEIENVALKCKGVLECICFYDETLVLNVVINDDFNLEQLKDTLKKDLVYYQVPKKINLVNEIYKTPNGKIDRKKYKSKKTINANN